MEFEGMMRPSMKGTDLLKNRNFQQEKFTMAKYSQNQN